MATSLDPRLRALYLALVAVGVFFLPTWWMVGVVLAVQIVLWLRLDLGLRPLGRQVRKLALFLGVIFIAFSLVSHDPATDRWRTLAIAGLALKINQTGVLLGLTMVLRVLAVVLASQVARAGDPRALAAGLGKLGVPRIVALSIDSVLTLLGGDRGKGKGRGRGKGRRRGKGGGRGPGGETDSEGSFWAGLRRLARGDVSVLVDRLYHHVDRVEAHVAATLDTGDAAPDAEREAATTTDGDDEGGGTGGGGDGQPMANPHLARDVAVISGIALTMLGIKALKLLPGLPFAPGHKGVILIPLFIVAGFMTRSRAGATITGCTMGTVAFLLGDGRYGIFEIAKHITPGILVDLFMPFMRGLASRRKSIQVAAWPVFGVVIALGRFATVTAIALTVQAPALVYALLIPGLAIHATFGALSGLVAVPLLAALARRNAPQGASEQADPRSTGENTPGRGGGRGGGGGRGAGRGGGDGGRGGGRARGDDRAAHHENNTDQPEAGTSEPIQSESADGAFEQHSSSNTP